MLELNKKKLMENIVIETSPNNKEIELEKNDSVVIDVPFNPNDIKVSTQPLTLGDLIDRLEHDEIKLDTEFQRGMDLWSLTKKSRLIESVLLRLPIPTFYFDAKDDDKWRVIDGLQRISTLKSFVVDQSHALVDLEFLKEYEGKKYDELPRDLQRRIKTFPITAYILEKGTPDIVKYNIFSRINQGGLVLTPQEMRHALHQGKAAELVREMVDSESEVGAVFKQATDWRITNWRMEDRDFATRFAAFYLTPFQNYEPDLDSFLNKGMSNINKCSDVQIQKLKQDFIKAMNTAFEIFGNDAFRKRFNEDDYRKPINKALFEVLSVSFAKLSNEQCSRLIRRKIKFRRKFQALHNEENGLFLRSITQGTAQKGTVETRFKSIERIIRETLSDD